MNLNPFKKKTLADVLAGFKNTLKELDVLIADSIEEQQANTDEIYRLTGVNRELETTVAQASKVRRNIEKLIEE